MDILDLVKEVGLDPKRKASCHGGEYCSPCPFCKTGDDRFLVWPQRHNKDGSYTGGRYNCPRQCKKSGDAITFLCQYHGMSKHDAYAMLKIPRKEKRFYVPRPKPEYKPRVVNDPPELWQEKATAFVNWAHENLMSNQQALAMVTTRGFTLESIAKFKIGFNPQKIERTRTLWGLSETNDEGKTILNLHAGLIIPLFSNEKVIKIKVRRTTYEKELADYERAKAAGEKPKYKPSKYLSIAGGRSSPGVYGNTNLPVAFIQESEFDPLLIQQDCVDLCFSIALGGSSNPMDHDTYQLIKKTPIVLFCPDFDQPGIDAWLFWKMKIPSLIQHITPREKSPGDAFLAGLNLREWIEEGIEKAKEKG